MKKGQLSRHVDDRGILTIIDFSVLPFTPKRIFWITEVPPDTIRGQHAHKTTWQTIIVAKGRVCLEIKGSGQSIRTSIGEGEYYIIPPMTWVSLKFGVIDTVLLVACSAPYNAADYISDYDEFIKHIQS